MRGFGWPLPGMAMAVEPRIRRRCCCCYCPMPGACTRERTGTRRRSSRFGFICRTSTESGRVEMRRGFGFPRPMAGIWRCDSVRNCRSSERSWRQLCRRRRRIPRPTCRWWKVRRRFSPPSKTTLRLTSMGTSTRTACRWSRPIHRWRKTAIPTPAIPRRLCPAPSSIQPLPGGTNQTPFATYSLIKGDMPYRSFPAALFVVRLSRMTSILL
mmetsp:Transcript_24354/g.70067  ORF Transcript_24354/g.70067 Transcript_24354/m.70067 type:complete len:212 (+) Transcript_24354:389-1024(+)